MKRLDQLTFTRFFMIILVLLYHGNGGVYFQALKQLPFLGEILHSAPTAVSYLYVLSGFVMVLVYYRPTQKFDYSNYWRARFIRIYPLYIIAFLLTCYYYIDVMLRIKPQKILANVFVIQAWIPAYSQSFNYASWSMAVEFFFYTLFPFLIIWSYKHSTKKLITFSLVFWAVSQILYHILWTLYFPERSDWIVYFPPFHLNSFIMGVVGGIWYVREGQNQIIKPSTTFMFLLLSFILSTTYLVLSYTYYPNLPRDLQPMAGLLAPILLLFVLCLALDKSNLSTFLNRPTLINLGETSYAIYILHVPVVWLFERWLNTSGWFTNPRQIFEIITMPMLIAIGLIVHFYIDRPLRAWLKKTFQQVSFPLLLLDLAIITASVYFSFRLRFENNREYESYREMGRLIYYCAFFLRIALAIYFNTLSTNNLYLPLTQLIRPVLISVSIGSAILFTITYIGFATGWFENFPRSVFLSDWLIVLMLSLGTRLLFRFFTNRFPLSKGLSHV